MRLSFRYDGTPVDLGRIERPEGGWVNLDAAWRAGDNTLTPFDMLAVDAPTVAVESQGGRYWRLHLPEGGAYRLTITGQAEGHLVEVAQLKIARRR